MSLVHHKTLADQQKVLEHLSSLDNYYDYLFFTELIRIQLRQEYSYAPPNFHSFEKNGSTYWFMHRVFNPDITNNYFAAEGPLYENDLFDALEEYGRLYPVFGNEKHHLLTGQSEFIELVRKFADLKSPGVTINKNPCYRFYVSNEQKIQLENEKIVLPEGYEIGSIREDEAAIPARNWRHADPKEEELTRNRDCLKVSFVSTLQPSPFSIKVRHFPSSCVRFNGKLVGHYISEAAGSMVNQFVDKEHRRKGLGQAMEIDLCKKLIRHGHTPYKHVEFFNINVIKSCNKTTFLTRARTNEEDVTITYSEINVSTVYGLDEE